MKYTIHRIRLSKGRLTEKFRIMQKLKSKRKKALKIIIHQQFFVGKQIWPLKSIHLCRFWFHRWLNFCDKFYWQIFLVTIFGSRCILSDFFHHNKNWVNPWKCWCDIYSKFYVNSSPLLHQSIPALNWIQF